MTRRSLLTFLCATASVLAGCTTVSKSVSDVSDVALGSAATTHTLIPDKTLSLTPSVSIPLEKVIFWGAYAGVAYLILDPFTPNWEIEEARLGDQYVHFNLKMKRYYAGGAGEARMVFNQRAKELVRSGGYASYQVVEYTEGLESSVLGSQRVSQGVIKLIPKA